MSRDYSPTELVHQSFYQFKDASLFGLIKLNDGPRLPQFNGFNIPHDRRHRTAGERIIFHPKNGGDITSHRRSLGSVPSDGVSSGAALNHAHPTAKRDVRIGRPGYTMKNENGDTVQVFNPDLGRMVDEVEQFHHWIPVNDKQWSQHGQWPQRPDWDDRSGAWVFPDGSIVSVWGYQPRPGEWPIKLPPFYAQRVNHGYTWGRFNNRGELVEGSGGSTANGTPWPSTTLRPELVKAGVPVTLGIFAPIYSKWKRPVDGEPRVQVDGLLEQPDDDWGLFCGDHLMWRENDEIIKWLRSIGPNCDYIAECMVTCGLVVDDQAGSQVPVEYGADGLVVTSALIPKAPVLRVQASREWVGTDLRDFQFTLSEARLAVEQGLEFRVEGDPHTPFEQPVKPDERVERIQVASTSFVDEVTGVLGETNAGRVLDGHYGTVAATVSLLENGGV